MKDLDLVDSIRLKSVDDVGRRPRRPRIDHVVINIQEVGGDWTVRFEWRLPCHAHCGVIEDSDDRYLDAFRR